MSERARVSVVILNWNGGGRLLDAIQSVLSQTHDDLELIVVDNGSTDGSLDAMPDDSRIAVHRNGRNLGYARGMNVGWRAASGDVWIPMNDDAILEPTFIELALETLADHPRAAAVAPLITSPGRPQQAAGIEELTYDMRVVPDGRVSHVHTGFKANGACPVYRRAALEQVIEVARVGPFDPWFDSYGEDTDLAFRLWSLGWETVFDPSVKATHVLSASSAPSVSDKRGRLRQNVVAARHANAWRHLPLWQLVGAVPLIALGDVVFALLTLAKGDTRGPADVAVAWSRVVKGLPGMASERRAFPPRACPHVGRRMILRRRG